MTADSHYADARDHHLIECRSKFGTYFLETEPGQTFAQAVEAIRSGNAERVNRVLQFNVGENFARDVTEDAAREIVNSPAGTVIARSALEFAEWHVGTDVVNEAKMVCEVA